MILCDTNILIEFYKNNSTIISQLRGIGLNQLAISTISQAELYFGAINKIELQKIKRHLGLLHTLTVDEKVSHKFIELMETYSLSHKLTIPDALIAATAIIHDIELYSLNVRDFRFIISLKLH